MAHSRQTARMVVVIVGFITFVVVGGQAILMQTHAGHLKDFAGAATSNAEAARLGAQALINAERAWLTIRVAEHPTRKGEFFITAKNRGKTPAKIVGLDSKVGVFELEDPEDLIIPPDYDNPVSIWGTHFIVKGFVVGRGFIPKELFPYQRGWEVTDSPKRYLMTYGRIQYEDVFPDCGPARVPRETCWCFVFVTHRERFEIGGKPEYNRNT